MEDNQSRPKPNNYLALAIICTVACCLIPGIVSIVYSTKVNEAYARGEYEAAEKASKNAKTWALAGMGIVAVFWILYIAIFGFTFLAALSSGDY
ncbi:CD225/dispanin family protein [Flavobacteriaceae bacterium 3-367]|uniref:CD225/dispanin family protein n=1 Tax=Eudoraea algarum TaxID=3417568 RepID=UPI003279B2EF